MTIVRLKNVRGGEGKEGRGRKKTERGEIWREMGGRKEAWLASDQIEAWLEGVCWSRAEEMMSLALSTFERQKGAKMMIPIDKAE